MRTLGQFFNLKAKEETSFLFGNMNNQLETYFMLLFIFKCRIQIFDKSDIAFSMSFSLVKFSMKFRKRLYQIMVWKIKVWKLYLFLGIPTLLMLLSNHPKWKSLKKSYPIFGLYARYFQVPTSLLMKESLHFKIHTCKL